MLDTGALLSVERKRRRMLLILERAHRNAIVPVVPAQILAQYWRGGDGRQSPVARLLQSCEIEHLDGLRAREAGVLLGRSETTDEADAVVALLADEHGAVATSDTNDIRLLLRELHSTAQVLDV